MHSVVMCACMNVFQLANDAGNVLAVSSNFWTLAAPGPSSAPHGVLCSFQHLGGGGEESRHRP